jgi:hypothetical protein
MEPTAMLLMAVGFQYFFLHQHQQYINKADRVVKDRNSKLSDMRAVYRYKDLYYKLWNHNDAGVYTVLQAIYVGLYDKQTVPCLKGLLFDNNNICMGYVTYKCPLSVVAQYNTMIDILTERLATTGFYYQDLRREHIRNYNGYPSLIDLEEVWPCDCGLVLPRDRKYQEKILELRNEISSRS